MESVREQIQLFTRRFGLLNASCCDECCGEDISMAQSHILSEIRRAGSPAMQEVAEELGMDITTFSRQVKSLEAKGLVCRRVSPDDRRVSLLGLTGAGLQVLGKIDGYMAARLERVFSRMSAFECEIVTRSLSLLNESLVGNAQGTANREGAVVCCK